MNPSTTGSLKADRPKTVVALIFDFDDTLAPDSTAFLVHTMGVDPNSFWSEFVDRRVSAGWDPVLAYLFGVWKTARSQGFSRDQFRRTGMDLPFFPGARAYLHELAESKLDGIPEATVEVYVMSSGIGEVIRATGIEDTCRWLWASEFSFDPDGLPEFPRNVVSISDKTRFLFEVSKGFVGENYRGKPFEVNKKLESADFRVPFYQMIFVGDGYTDVPGFHLVRRYGGAAIGVYPHGAMNETRSQTLLRDKRVSQLFPADYRKGSRLRDAIHQEIHRAAERGRKRSETGA